MDIKPSVPARSLTLAFIMVCSALLACGGLIDTGGIPPTLSPSDVTAQADLRQARMAAADSVVASGLVRETKTIAAVAHLIQAEHGGHRLFVDGQRLWIADSQELLAIDPESGETVVGPITVNELPSAAAFDGKQIWWLTYSGLQAVDVNTGKLGTLIQMKCRPSFLVYGGKRLWCSGEKGLLSADPVSLQAMPPIGPDKVFTAAAVDEGRSVLWLGNTEDKVQKYDLQQNQLLDTSLPFAGIGSLKTDGGQLWLEHGSHWAAFDPVTEERGATITLTVSYLDSVIGGGRFWFSNNFDWTIQSYDIATGQPYPPIPVAGIPVSLAFDGKRLWITLFDPETQQFKGLQSIIPN